MKMLTRAAIALALFAAAAASAPASATERVSRFVSDVNVQRNGDLLVTETLDVIAEGDRIKHGIRRSFPTQYTDADGSHVEIGFEVLSVMRDGSREPYATHQASNGVIVQIGSADTTLSGGSHQYVIAYRTTRQLGFFKDFDELYWNVTGTGWAFPIDVAEARINLPEGVPFRRNAIYTGVQGAKGTDAAVIEEKPGRIVFRTTRPLPPNNGLTVAASWPMGLVARPGDTEKKAMWLRDNLPLGISVLGLLLMLGYYFYAWRKVGHDPRKGHIIPLFAPPNGMSPAAVRYVSRMDSDERTFSAALVDLAVHSWLKLTETKGGMKITPRDSGKPVDAAEVAVHTSLFGKRKSPLELEPENALIFQRAQKVLKQELSKAYDEKLFHRNTAWSVRGLLFSFAVIAAVVVSVFQSWGSYQGSAMILGMLSFVPIILVLVVLATLRRRSVVAWPLLAFGCLFGAIVGHGGIGILQDALHGWVPAVPAALPLVLLPIASSAFSWMRAYTPEGRSITDQIEGFRHYLGVAEEDRLNALNPPEKTPELFERFLPYAIALDVENAWAKRFAGVLAAMAVTEVANEWYSSHDNNRDPTSFVTSLGSGLTDTIASASTPPGSSGSSSSDSSSSSSGSDGGGSSGGGGGGGGGDGW